MLKRIFSLILALMTLALLLCPAEAAKGDSDAPELSSKSAIVYSLNSKDVIWEKEADLVLAPASLTKITTTMTVLSLCDDPDNTFITVPDAGLFEEITAVGGSNIELQVGERLSVTELLWAVMLPSACDACNVLAYHFGNGSIASFVTKMNDWARSAGAEQTNFQNAHGLDAPGHKSSARDTALILLEALENERFYEMVTSEEYIIPENSLHAKRYINYQSTIPMLYSYNAEYYRGMSGIKSGYTLQAGCCLSSMAERDGERFLVVCLGAEKKDGVNHARTDTAALYDWAFENFETRTLTEAGNVLRKTQIEGATTESAGLLLREDLVVCVNKNAGEPTLRYDLKKPLAPPFDEEAGTLEVVQGERVLATAALYFDTVPTAAPVEEDVDTEILPTTLSPIVVVAILVGVVLLLLFAAVLLVAVRPKPKARPAARGGTHPAVRKAPPAKRPQAPSNPPRRPTQNNRRQG